MNEIEIFIEALKRCDQAERAAYLDAACGSSGAFRARLDELLAMHLEHDPLLERGPDELLMALGASAADSGTAPDTTAQQLSEFLTPPTRPESLGRLGHYEVLQVLGRGGFGIVFKAEDSLLRRIVAIKVLAPHLATTSPPRKRFLREARAAAAVRHEHVVQIYAVHEEPLPHLVMEFVAGLTLQAKLDRDGPLEPPEVVRLGCQIARGLAAAHAKGLVHRDVKPANILLEDGVEPHARLTDFGLARAADDASITQSGFIAGSPLYMAPEQVQGTALDARTDLFSFGSVLYTMTTGRPAFRAPTAFAVLKRVADETQRPVREVIETVPSALAAVIDKLLSKRPDERFATAAEAAEALARCLTNPIPVRVTRRLRGKVAILAAAVLLVVGAGWLVRQFAWSTDGRGGSSPVAANQPGDATPGKEPAAEEPGKGLPKAPSWEDGVALMPAEDQVLMVVAKLKQLNPKFDETSIAHRIDKDVVVELRINNCENLDDLSPVHALAGLKELYLKGNGVADISPLRGMRLTTFNTLNTPIKDLSPLAGMPLKVCCLWGFATDDLSPLAGMQLEGANVGASSVRDISVLKPMKLKYLCLNHSQVNDLTPLEGQPLEAFECQNTSVTDLRPLAKSPIHHLTLKGSPIADYAVLKQLPLRSLEIDYQPDAHAQLLRSIPTLKTINGQPADTFLGKDGQ